MAIASTKQAHDRTFFRRCVGVFLAVSLLACRPDVENPGASIQRIVLVSIDTLRADALGAYGNPLNTSPYIDAIAEQGTLFENCIAPSPMTFPSHATMLTGLHPLQHGVLVNMQAKLPPGITTLPERLGQLGWRTGAVVSSTVLHRRFDLDRGFDDYRDDFYSSLYGSGDHSLERTDARKTTAEAIEWLENGSPDRKEFLFVHYIDPHSPYNAPRRVAAKFPGSPYLAEVAFVDRQLFRLVNAVNNLSEDFDTLWIITSDHGEALGEHGENTHGFFLYDEIVRVPLILAGPGVAGGQVVTEPVGLIDIVPTVLDLVGAPPDPDLPGRAIPTTDPDRSFVSTSYISSLGFGWSPLWSLSGKGERFILGPEREYYRTDIDPEETENLWAQTPSRANELEHQLRQRGAHYLSGAHAIETSVLDSNSIDQLAALGYVEASADSANIALDDFSGANPREMYGVVEKINEYADGIRRGDYAAAQAALREAEELDPGNTAFDTKRAQLLMKMGRAEEFLAWIAEKSQAFQEEPIQRHLRAQALAVVGRFEEAAQLLRQSIDRDPENLPSIYELAGIQLKIGQDANAATSYARVIQLDPLNISALINYANLLTKRGEPGPASGHLETVISIQPDNAKAHRNLGIVYAKLDRFDDAIRHLERSRTLRPSETGATETQMIEALRAVQEKTTPKD